MDKNLAEQLCDFAHGKVCVMGIGDRHWQDIGVGTYIAEALDASPGLEIVDAGFVPENHLESIAEWHPDCVLMVDASDFGGEPGQARLIFPERVPYSSASTQAGSLRILAEYMHASMHADIALLAIQPGETGAGESLSPAVAETFLDLVQHLAGVCGKKH